MNEVIVPWCRSRNIGPLPELQMCTPGALPGADTAQCFRGPCAQRGIDYINAHGLPHCNCLKKTCKIKVICRDIHHSMEQI